jgi:hypothetical protein
MRAFVKRVSRSVPAACCALLMSVAAVPDATAAPAAVPAPSAPAPGYAPVYLPREVQLLPQEVAQIREAMARQAAAVYLAQASRMRQQVWADEQGRAMQERRATLALIVFWVVILVVVAGVAMAGYQLVREIPGPAAPAHGGRDPYAAQGEQFLKRAASRILAVVTLLASMLLLYACLANLYPLTASAAPPAAGNGAGP